MPVSSSPARHRAAGRPCTALSDLAGTAISGLGLVGRRSVVVAASSGLIMSAFAAPASASPSVESVAAVPAVDTSALTASARAALNSAPVVTVPADAAWSLDVPSLTITADPPSHPSRVVRSATPRAAAPASANGSAIIEVASRYVGIPYVWGGGTPNGFDCSGFTSYVYAQMGVSLPHSSAAQRYAGTVVARADAQPGDLIVTPGHVAIYAGGGMLIDATPGNTIRFHAIYQSSPVFIRIG